MLKPSFHKRYEFSNHASTSLSTGASISLSTCLGNVLAVISDRKLLVCNEYNKLEDFEGTPNLAGAWNVRDSWSGQNAVISLEDGKLSHTNFDVKPNNLAKYRSNSCLVQTETNDINFYHNKVVWTITAMHAVLNIKDNITADPHARYNYFSGKDIPPNQSIRLSFDLEHVEGDHDWQVGIVYSTTENAYQGNMIYFSATSGHNEINAESISVLAKFHLTKQLLHRHFASMFCVQTNISWLNFVTPGYFWRVRLLHIPTAQDMEFNLDNFHIENLTQDSASKCHAAVISATDYSPFGAPLAGRTYQASEYRFGFNGKEKDDEVSGTGNSYSAEHWQYSPRLGRRFNLDPIYKSSRSNYSVLSNSPIIFVDPLGDDDFYNKAGKYVGSIGTGTAIRVINKMNVSSTVTFKAAMNTPETKALIEASPVVKIQENQQQAIADLYNSNNQPGTTEKVAYVILDVEKATLSLVTINTSSDNNSTSNPHESHSGGVNGDYISIVGDKNQVIVGQIHTHPPNADGSLPASKVSEEGGLGVPKDGSDVAAAKKLKVPIHAVDNKNIHKVSTDGTIKNNLPMNTEVLKSSLEESGGKK